jgi:hypothetical protein
VRRSTNIAKSQDGDIETRYTHLTAQVPEKKPRAALLVTGDDASLPTSNVDATLRSDQPGDKENPEDHHRRPFQWWAWEIAASVISLLAMLAIGVTFAYYEGRPVPTRRMGITFNGLIAIYSLMAKLALLVPVTESLGQLKWNRAVNARHPLSDFKAFDAATRGISGSIRLLQTTRFTFVDSRVLFDANLLGTGHLLVHL